MTTTFRELAIGDEFDFIGHDRMLNSFYDRCRKISPRGYVSIAPSKPWRMRVGTINVTVHNVERKAVQS